MSIKNIIIAGAITVASATFTAAGAIDNGFTHREYVSEEPEVTQANAAVKRFCEDTASRIYDRGTAQWQNWVAGCVKNNS